MAMRLLFPDAPAAPPAGGRRMRLATEKAGIYEAYAGPETGGFGVLPQSAVQGLELDPRAPAMSLGVSPLAGMMPQQAQPQRLAPPSLPMPSSGLTIAPKGGAPRVGTPDEAAALKIAEPFLQPKPPVPTRGQAFGRAMFNRGLRMFTHLPNAPGTLVNAAIGTDVVPPLVTAEPEELRAAFGPTTAQQEFETSARYGQQRPYQTMGGELGMDALALTGLRQPALGPLRAREITQTEGLRAAEYTKTHTPEKIARTFAEWKDKQINAPRFWGLSKGTGRIGEATAEGLVLGVLNEQDPLTTAAMAGGGQALGSGILFLARPPAGTKYKSLNIGAKALAAGTLFHLLTGGYLMNDIETGFEKIKIGLGAAAVAGLAGTGRLRAQNLPGKAAARVLDSIASIPRHSLISLAQRWQSSDEPTRRKIEKAVEIMGGEPGDFKQESIDALSNAFDKGGDTFFRTMNRIIP